MFPTMVQKFVDMFPGGEQYELRLERDECVDGVASSSNVKAGERVLAYKLQRPETEIWFNTRAGLFTYRPTHVGVLVVVYETANKRRSDGIDIAVNATSFGHGNTFSTYLHGRRTVYVVNQDEPSYYIMVTGYSVSGEKDHPHSSSGGYLGLLLGGVDRDERGDLRFDYKKAWGNSAGKRCAHMCLDSRFLKRAAQAIADGDPQTAMAEVDSVLCSANINDMPHPVWPCYECQNTRPYYRWHSEGCEHYPEGPIALCKDHRDMFSHDSMGIRVCTKCYLKPAKEQEAATQSPDLRLGGIAGAAGLSFMNRIQEQDARRRRDFSRVSISFDPASLSSGSADSVFSRRTVRLHADDSGRIRLSGREEDNHEQNT